MRSYRDPSQDPPQQLNQPQRRPEKLEWSHRALQPGSGLSIEGVEELKQPRLRREWQLCEHPLPPSKAVIQPPSSRRRLRRLVSDQWDAARRQRRNCERGSSKCPER